MQPAYLVAGLVLLGVALTVLFVRSHARRRRSDTGVDATHRGRRDRGGADGVRRGRHVKADVRRQTIFGRLRGRLAGPDRLRHVSQRSLSTGRRTAMLVIGVHGVPETGDARILPEFTAVLRRCVPRTALPAHLGGAEFAVALPEINFPEEAYEVAGRLAAALGPIVADGHLVTLAAAIGVAVAEPAELTHDELVHRATLAMHRAKALGPDTRWAVWQEDRDPGFPAAA